MTRPENQPARFITFEGGEGVGKSTQCKRLCTALQAIGFETALTREPGGVKAAEEIRKMILEGEGDKWSPIAEMLLFNAARKQHVDELIVPAMKSGKWVVCDRFADSTMAYQGYVKGMARETVLAVQKITLGDFRPDLTIMIDLPTEVSLERVNNRRGKKDRIESDYHKTHRILRGAFLDIAGAESDRCIVIDGTGNLDMVTTRIFAAINARFHLSLSYNRES